MNASNWGAIAARIGNGISPDTITINGVSMQTTTGALSVGETAMLPDGARNAANSDGRYFLLTTADVAAKLAVTPESLETKSGTYRGSQYTFERVLVQGAGGTVKLIAYRAPQLGTSTQDAATGKRKTFAPPDQS